MTNEQRTKLEEMLKKYDRETDKLAEKVDDLIAKGEFAKAHKTDLHLEFMMGQLDAVQTTLAVLGYHARWNISSDDWTICDKGEF